MLFNSYHFIFLFLPVVWWGHRLLVRLAPARMALAWLVLTSLFFYGWWNPDYLWLLAGSVSLNYGFGLLLARDKGSSLGRKGLLFTGVALNLALIGVFKYAGFFADTLNRLIGTGWDLPPILLPLAISFFTFQQIAYLVDQYHGTVPRHGFLQYALYVVFFPQLIAGPIVRPSEMLPQYARSVRTSEVSENLSVGLTLFIIGLFKKVVLADSLARYATPVFNTALEGSVPLMAEAWTGAFAYAFQLYFDFSGYSDMALGLARMFGYRLPLNFHSPYQAVSIIDFWRRWHMTLSRFMLDYLYIPLGGNRHGPMSRTFNLLFTMLLGGLWHGAQWTFVVWGMIHGLYLAWNHVWQESTRSWAEAKQTAAYQWTARGVTLLFLMLAWVVFRAESFDAAFLMFRGMAGASGAIESGVPGNGPLWVAVGWTLCWALPNSTEWLKSHTPALHKLPEGKGWGKACWQPRPSFAVGILILAVFTIFQMTSVSEFLYFQF